MPRWTRTPPWTHDTPIISDYYIVSQGVAMKVVEGSENEGAPYGFAIFKGENQELAGMFNAGLKSIQDNGKYDEIIAKYLGYQKTPFCMGR